METKQRDELRYVMETQFRYKFYKSPEFPFLPSMGIRHIFQGFEHKAEFGSNIEDLGFIGILHLWWTLEKFQHPNSIISNEDYGIVYDNPRNFIKGTWHGEWFDKPEDGIGKAIQVQTEVTVWDVNKLLQVHHEFHQKLRKKEAEKKFTEEAEEMDVPISKRLPLLN